MRYKEILGKSQIWVEIWVSLLEIWVSLLEIKFGNSSQKARTNRYQTFLVLSSFSGFLYFFRDCSSYETLSWLFKSLFWCQKKVVAGIGIKTDILRIPYSVFQILIPKFTFAPTSFDSVSLLTFHTSTILVPLWFTNIERCRFQNLSIFTLSCWLVLLGMVKDVEQNGRFSVQ